MLDRETKLNPTGWYLEEIKKTEQVLDFMRNRLGSHFVENDRTYNLLEGYLKGIHRMYREFEQDTSKK